MTFIEALKSGRPMRRKSGTGIFTRPWVYLGEDTTSSIDNRPVWRRIDTGELIGLHSYDYAADDWEVMP